MKLIRLAAIVSMSIAFGIGCSATEEVQEEVAPEPVVEQPMEPAPTPMAVDVQPMPQGDPLDEGLLAQKIVYFDFDKYNINEEFRDVLSAHAEYLANNPSAKVTIEGHCDERGTREYNIGLGERRASAIQQMLTLQGASSRQINTVSYGEERPTALGHDEEAWSRNRRGEIIYTSK